MFANISWKINNGSKFLLGEDHGLTKALWLIVFQGFLHCKKFGMDPLRKHGIMKLWIDQPRRPLRNRLCSGIVSKAILLLHKMTKVQTDPSGNLILVELSKFRRSKKLCTHNQSETPPLLNQAFTRIYGSPTSPKNVNFFFLYTLTKALILWSCCKKSSLIFSLIPIGAHCGRIMVKIWSTFLSPVESHYKFMGLGG